MSSSQRRDPDRLLPADPRTRDIARRLYEAVAKAPIVSPHGHVPVEWLRDDTPFENPTALLVTHDHYVTRMLHAAGVDYAQLGLGGHAADPREVWRILASHWHLFAGTASGYWLEEEFTQVLGIDAELNADTADHFYDEIATQLESPGFRPRALFERFEIEVLATTDDPLDDLSAHAALRGVLPGRVLPTFRPDRYLDPSVEGFGQRVEALLGLTGERDHVRRIPSCAGGSAGALRGSRRGLRRPRCRAARYGGHRLR